MTIQNIFFIDARVQNYQAFVAGLQATDAWVLLNPDQDGLDQMVRALSGFKDLASIQIISHGAQASLTLGSTALNLETVQNYQVQLAVIGASLSTQGDIQLYGCDVAQGAKGEQFVQAIAQLTQADVAASTDLTGASAAGGNWTLEYAVGQIDSSGNDTINGLGGAGTLAANSAPVFLLPGDGKVTLALGPGSDEANGMALQSDGKIVLAGFSIIDSGLADFSLSRFNSDGSLDTGFGQQGKVINDAGGLNDFAYSVALSTNQKILVLGHGYFGASGNTNPAVMRFNADGSKDTNFDSDGLVDVNVAGDDTARAIALQADGKIVVAATTNYVSSSGDFSLVRLNDNGSLDTSFASGGKVSTSVGSELDLATTIAVQADGKLLLAGYALNGVNSDFGVIRYNSNGSLDTTFNTTGRVVTSLVSGSDQASSMALQADGKILVAGHAYNGSNNDFALVRYNSNGSLDTSFNSTGKVITAFGSGEDRVSGIALQADGKILLAGYSYNGSNNDFALARYNTNGSLDTAFGTSGKVSTAIGTASDIATSISVQPDGKILLAGTSSINDNNDFALVRYNSDGSLDFGFDSVFVAVTSTPPAANFTENGSASLLHPSAMVADLELKNAGTYAGATLTLSRQGGANNEDAFSHAGNLALLTEGSGLNLAGTTIGTVTQNSSGVLSLSFNSNATQALLNGAMQCIAYSNTSDAPPSSVKIDWLFSDGNTGSQGSGGALSAMLTSSVNITSVNDVPTGSVFISGTATQGQTLTAGNTLADIDGIPVSGVGAISYHWSAGGAAIANATGSTYVLTQAEVGKAITVTASYTDQQGTAESVTSTATAAVANVNDAPTGTARMLSTESVASTRELLASDITNTATQKFNTANSHIYEYVDANVTWTAAKTAAEAKTLAGLTGYLVTITSASEQSFVLANNVTSVGRWLGASDAATEGTWRWVTGPEEGLQFWSGSSGGSAVNGAYKNWESDEPNNSADDDYAHFWPSSGLWNDAPNAGIVIGSNPRGWVGGYVVEYSGTVNTSGSQVPSNTESHFTEDKTLYADGSLLGDPDGMGALSYQWQRATDANANGSIEATEWSNIQSAIATTYTLGDADSGGYIRLAIGYTDALGTQETVYSGSSLAIKNINDEPTGGVTISGTATQGQVLTASNTLADLDGIPVSGVGAISYHWSADAVAIANATGSTYVLTQAEVGKAITVKASYTDQQGTAESKTSSATASVANINDAPTGSVTITGTATQGQTLTAANTLADIDGIPVSGVGAISYQWSADAAVIANATGSTYVLTQAEVGMAITVTASYTDQQGTAESKTSSATASVANINDAPTGSVSISGTASQGQTLTAANTLADVDGIPDSGVGAIIYQWSAGGASIANATGITYVLTQAEVGKAITVTASYTDQQGTAESKASSATASVANVNDSPTGSVTISGTATQGQTLTAANTLADVDGIPESGVGAISYQWSAGGAAIVNATGSTYVLTQAEVGKAISVTASYTDQQGTAESKASSATASVANVNDSPTGSVTISGTATQGQTLTAANTLADVDGIPESGVGAISYHWSADAVAIANATGSTYVLTQAEVGKAITVKASYTDQQGTAESKTSSATASVANVNDSPTGSVTISGTATQGQTLTAANTLADIDGIPSSDSGAISYHWSADGAAIVNATGSTYVLTQAEVGKAISVTASYTDQQGTAESKASDATSAVANVNDSPTGVVTITGTATQGQTLTAANTLADVDGIPVSGVGAIGYQWQWSTDGNMPWTSIDGTLGDALKLSSAHLGHHIRVLGSYTDEQGLLEAVASHAVWITLDANFVAYSWKAHTLLAGVDLTAGTHSSSTDSMGAAGFKAITQSNLSLSASRTVPADEVQATTNAVNLQDAIAILKMIVGLNVNGANQPLSPYQALAADFDGNSRVELNDAIGVLKHVVGLTGTGTPKPEWRFVDEANAAVVAIKGNAALSPGQPPAINLDLTGADATVQVGLVGYLRGDVDGSFAGASGALDLDDAQPGYFTDLVADQPALNLAQFGIYTVG